MNKETMDALNAAQLESYKNGRDDEQERCAQLCEQIQRNKVRVHSNKYAGY